MTFQPLPVLPSPHARPAITPCCLLRASCDRSTNLSHAPVLLRCRFSFPETMHHRPLGTLVSLGVVGWYSGYVYASFAYLRRRDGGRRAVRRRGHTRRTDGLDDRHGRPAAIILGHVNCVPQELLATRRWLVAATALGMGTGGSGCHHLRPPGDRRDACY